MLSKSIFTRNIAALIERHRFAIVEREHFLAACVAGELSLALKFMLKAAIQSMKISTYKSTHRGDPQNQGVFGINHCMGTIRNRTFDAVIGMGALNPCQDEVYPAGSVG